MCLNRVSVLILSKIDPQIETVKLRGELADREGPGYDAGYNGYDDGYDDQGQDPAAAAGARRFRCGGFHVISRLCFAPTYDTRLFETR